MQTSKTWEKIGDYAYALWDNNEQVGKIDIAIATIDGRATASIQNKEFIIKRVGFWKSNIEITDNNDVLIAKIYPEKWYHSFYVMESNGKKYKLVVRNNPLAEWALQENDQDLLTYKLTSQDAKPTVKITSTETTTNYLFDFILWYLFVPIIIEQSGGDVAFILMVS